MVDGWAPKRANDFLVLDSVFLSRRKPAWLRSILEREVVPPLSWLDPVEFCAIMHWQIRENSTEGLS
jgi:hypothetical protein